MHRQPLMIFFVSIFVLFVVVVPSISCAYLGEYQNGSVVSTPKVICLFNFVGTNATAIDDAYNGPLQGVLTVAGKNSTYSPSGWVYQSVSQLYHNGSVMWSPEYFNKYIGYSWYTWVWSGNTNYVAFYNKIVCGSNGYVTMYSYVYKDLAALDRDAPSIYYKTTVVQTNDTSLLAGKYAYNSSANIFYLQAGVEQAVPLTTSWWKQLNDHFYYYDSGTSTWKYYPGNALWGSRPSYVSYLPNQNPEFVGNGWTMSGQSANYTSADMVQWQEYGNSIADDTSLWSSSGSMSDIVSTPYS